MVRNFLLIVVFLSTFACNVPAKYPIVVIETSYGTMKVKLYEETPQHSKNFIQLVEDGFYNELLFHRVINNFMIQAGDPNSKNAAPGARLGSGGPGYTIPAEINSTLYHKKGALSAARQPDNVNPKKASSGSQFYIVQGTVFSESSLTIDQNKMRKYIQQLLQLPEYAGFRQQVIDLQNQRKNNELMQLVNSYADTVEAKFNVSVKKDIDPQRLKDYSTIGGTPHLDNEYTVFGEVIEGLEIIDKIATVATDAANRPTEDVIIKKIYTEKN